MRLFKDIPSGVWAIGVVTLLVNLSGVIIFFLSPFYLRSLGVDYGNLGIIEGIVEWTSWMMRFASGFLSDFFHQRKPALLIAYSISAVARPILMFLPAATLLMMSRMLDRMGNGIQASPREALVGDLAPPQAKAACFGLRQSLSVVGSFVGAGVVWWVMRQTGGDYQAAFTVAAIPPVIAVIVLYFFVSETPRSKKIQAPKVKVVSLIKELRRDITWLKKPYWLVVGFSCLFMMSNFSGMFLSFKATDSGLSEADAALVMIVQNIMTACAAYPIGRWADRVDRRIPLAIGIILVIIGNVVLATAVTPTEVLVGVAIWGFQMGISASLIAAKITDATHEDVRGTAFGIYYVLVGFALFATNSLSGWLAEHISLERVFWVSAIYAALALAVLPLLRPQGIKARNVATV
ncbi:MAG: MFS transporter [bacterium]|nr:MFS transporter [bacterium]